MKKKEYNDFLNFTKGMNAMGKGMKIRVLSPGHSRLIQEVAFKLGWEWINSGTCVKFTGEKYLYLDVTLDGDKYLSYGKVDSVFEGSLSKEVELNIDIKFVEVGKDIVEVNGKKYLLKDLEKALENIKEV